MYITGSQLLRKLQELDIRYFLIVLMLVVFVLLYVWQNIEIIKITMDFRTLAKSEKNLLVERNRLLHDIEKLTQHRAMGEFGQRNQYRRILKGDVQVLNKSGDQ